VELQRDKEMKHLKHPLREKEQLNLLLPYTLRSVKKLPQT
jgi:hypothetical protein